jgi:hypothetical protein
MEGKFHVDCYLNKIFELARKLYYLKNEYYYYKIIILLFGA